MIGCVPSSSQAGEYRFAACHPTPLSYALSERALPKGHTIDAFNDDFGIGEKGDVP